MKEDKIKSIIEKLGIVPVDSFVGYDAIMLGLRKFPHMADEYHIRMMHEPIESFWDLNRENLYDQSEETVDFLFRLSSLPPSGTGRELGK